MAGRRGRKQAQGGRYTTQFHERRSEERLDAERGLRRLLLVLIGVLVAFLVASVCIAFATGAVRMPQTDGGQDQTQTQATPDSTQGDGQKDGGGQTEADTDTAQQQEGQQQQQQAQQAQQTQASGEDRRTATSDSDNRTKPGRKVCYLTFDDGPSENTHKILDILDTYDVKATWFVIGTSGHLDYAKDIWAAGHQIGLHTWDHDYDTVYASSAAFWNSIDKIGDAVADEIGSKPTLIRFPGGSVNDYNRSLYQQLCTEAGERGYHYFDWNVSSGDASPRGLSADEIYNNVTGEAADNNSSCVLMHDTEAKGTTVEALPRMIEWFKANGYEFDVLQADSFGYHYWPVDVG